MSSSTISPTNSKKLLIGSTRSVDYVGDSAKTTTTTAANIKAGAGAIKGTTAKGHQKGSTLSNTTKISIEMELHIQNKCISA